MTFTDFGLLVLYVVVCGATIAFLVASVIKETE